jgi:uncharacterized membrane protein YhaH (DUF805 family)
MKYYIIISAPIALYSVIIFFTTALRRLHDIEFDQNDFWQRIWLGWKLLLDESVSYENEYGKPGD